MLRTKCIFAPVRESDGLRVSVMSRHSPICIDMSTLDDINAELAPPSALVGEYYRNGMSWWGEYEKRYLAHLKTEKARNAITQLISLALDTDVSVLCVEESPEFCHRRLLAEECALLCTDLDVVIE